MPVSIYDLAMMNYNNEDHKQLFKPIVVSAYFCLLVQTCKFYLSLWVIVIKL